MTKTTTKKTARIKSNPNIVTPTNEGYVAVVDMMNVWKVSVPDTKEIFFAYSKEQALNYVAKKGATMFVIKQTKVPLEAI